MGKVIDISMKIKHEPVFINLGDGMSYKVNDNKNNVIEIMQMWDSTELTDIDKIDKTIEKCLGKEALKAINKLDLNIQGYKEIAMAIMATVTGQELEEFEARFQESAEK